MTFVRCLLGYQTLTRCSACPSAKLVVILLCLPPSISSEILGSQHLNRCSQKLVSDDQDHQELCSAPPPRAHPHARFASHPLPFCRPRVIGCCLHHIVAGWTELSLRKGASMFASVCQAAGIVLFGLSPTPCALQSLIFSALPSSAQLQSLCAGL